MSGVSLASAADGALDERAKTAFVRIVKGALAAGASDLHLRAGRPPLVRLQGELLPLEHPPISDEFVSWVRGYLAELAGLPATRRGNLQDDYSLDLPEVGRFRVHAYLQRGGSAIVMRSIPSRIPGFADLRVPPVVKRLVNLERGLVLVTGATGNGKSTTVAALLERVNQERRRHILTIEDPVEFVFEENHATFSYREVGRDVEDFYHGLIGGLRVDADWIFVGEIRCKEEFDVALSAAEAGHVVVSTLHAKDSVGAVSRLVGFYQEGYRDSIRQRLADALESIVSQRLVRARGGRQRLLVTEVLMRSPTIQDCIRDPNRTRALTSSLEAGTSEYGTHSFDQQLLQMMRDGLIDESTARAVSSNPTDLLRSARIGRRF